MSPKFLRPLVFVLLLAFSVPGLAQAAVLDDIARDFKPLSGYVIMPADQEVLIDLDAAKGVAVGDLFAIVKPGGPIVHPVTKEILGNLDEVKGVLKVTRLRSGYSYAVPLGGQKTASRGDVVRRFENMAATFADETGKGATIQADLQRALPALAWQPTSQSAGEPAALRFILKPSGLEIIDSTGQRIKSYPLPEGVVASSPASAAAATPTSVAAPAVLAAKPAAAPAVILPPVETTAEAAIVRRDPSSDQNIWTSSALGGSAVGVEVADFDGDGRQEVAMAFGDRLELYTLENGNLRRSSTLEFGAARIAHTLDSADLDGDGKPELYVTATFGPDLTSMVVTLENGRLVLGQNFVSWFLRSVTLPGEGRVLLGQRMGSGPDDFSGQIYRMEKRGGEVAEGKPVALPAGTKLYGFAFLTTAKELALVRINNFDLLQVFGINGEKLWESDANFGGSESFFERKNQALARETTDTTRYVYFQSRIETDGDGSVLIPVNEGSRLFSRSKSFKKSLLRAMRWDGQELKEVWHTRAQNAYLADFRKADIDNDGQPELVQAVVYPGGVLDSKRRSALVVYELN